MSSKKKDEIAADRFQLIAPLLDEKLDKAEFIKKRREIAEKAGLSEKTICRYISRYCEKDFDGLRPLQNGRPGTRSFPPEILEEVIHLKLENPKRSISKIIHYLEITNKIKPGSVKRATLQDQLAKAGYSSNQIKLLTNPGSIGGQRFQHEHRNDLIQSDSKHGPYINKKKTYLISFIDDCTRYILHSQFYFAENTDSVFDCLRQAISKYGVPKAIYMDNGGPFRSISLKHAFGMLHIMEKHHKPYSSKSKGKIEKFHQIVDKFISEVYLQKNISLDSMNEEWTAYMQVYYQTVSHSSLPDKMTPESAFNADKQVLRFASKDDLFNAFTRVVCNRKVDKSGCFSFRGEKYTGEGLLHFIGKKADIFWDPSEPSNMWAESNFVPKTPLHKLVIKKYVPWNPPPPDRYQHVSRGSVIIGSAKEEQARREAARVAAMTGSNLNNAENIPQPADSSVVPGSVLTQTTEPNQPVEVQSKGIEFRKMKNLEDKSGDAKESGAVKLRGISFSSLYKNKGENDV
jgi:transposase InsO family protein